MDAPFIYDRAVTGKNFIGRKGEFGALLNLMSSGEHVVMYEPPKTGKKSLIQQVLLNMKLKGKETMDAQVELFNVRTLNEFLLKFGEAVIRPVSSTPAEYSEIVSKYLDGTHFVFDQQRFASEREEVVSLNWEADDNDLAKMLRLPQRLAEDRGKPFYVIFADFQNIMKIKDYESILIEMESVIEEINESSTGDSTARMSYVFVGSMVNAMKYIFENKKYFYRIVEHLPLQPVDDREIIEHIMRGFSLGGKVTTQELALETCKIFQGHLWYINHFNAICDSMSKGYMNNTIQMDALKRIIALHEDKFKDMVNDLTDHQMSLLRAVFDGVVKFSSSDVIEKYALNSSANVRRVKDALCKKEIITFNEKDEPVILDPLFEYWMAKFYFKIR